MAEKSIQEEATEEATADKLVTGDVLEGALADSTRFTTEDISADPRGEWNESQIADPRAWTKLAQVNVDTGLIDGFEIAPLTVDGNWQSFDFDEVYGYDIDLSSHSLFGYMYDHPGMTALVSKIYLMSDGSEFVYLYSDTEEDDSQYSLDTSTYGFDVVMREYPDNQISLLTNRFGGLSATADLIDVVFDAVQDLAVDLGGTTESMDVTRFIRKPQFYPGLSTRFPFESAAQVTSSAEAISAAGAGTTSGEY